jgi:hypothetical protein
MTFVVEEDETADPIYVGLLGSDAVALNAQMPADAVQQFLGGRWSRKRKEVLPGREGRHTDGASRTGISPTLSGQAAARGRFGACFARIALRRWY